MWSCLEFGASARGALGRSLCGWELQRRREAVKELLANQVGKVGVSHMAQAMVKQDTGSGEAAAGTGGWRCDARAGLRDGCVRYGEAVEILDVPGELRDDSTIVVDDVTVFGFAGEVDREALILEMAEG